MLSGEPIPIHIIPEITDIPIIWRYFVSPFPSFLQRLQMDEKEYTARTVMHINTYLKGAYVFSSGKNMGVFKAVGFPEDVGKFYKLDEYKAYSWTAHGRYPTNTPGWWGGAHPFSLLDYTVVHNGEISSYDANRRYIEMFGYKCTLQTDTEVITYIADYLLRRPKLSLEETASVIAAPFWSTIESKSEDQSKTLSYLRKIYFQPFNYWPFFHYFRVQRWVDGIERSIEASFHGLQASKDDKVYIASEESAIRMMEPDVENVYAPMGGEPLIVTVKEGAL